MWDLVDNADSIAPIESCYNSGKPVAAVCHAPAVLHSGNLPGRADREGQARHRLRQQRGGRSPAHTRRPFLVEDELKRLGGLYEKAPNWQSFVITDGRLITGQNPASSTAGAKALLKLLSDIQPRQGGSIAA